jgi:proteic killer suppression protein
VTVIFFLGVWAQRHTPWRREELDFWNRSCRLSTAQQGVLSAKKMDLKSSTIAFLKLCSEHCVYNASRYTIAFMIQSFKCSDTQTLFSGTSVARFINFQAVAERKLQMLHRATRLDDLRIPPNNKLEALKRDRKGQHSIRINDQWRVCFVWTGSNATKVEIVDYH